MKSVRDQYLMTNNFLITQGHEALTMQFRFYE